MSAPVRAGGATPDGAAALDGQAGPGGAALDGPAAPGEVAPGAAGRGRPRSARAEQAIRDAAIALLVERGVNGFSVEAVAARAGVAKTTIYRRWPTREDLIVAVVVELKGPAYAAPGDSVRGDLLHVLGQVSRRDQAALWATLMARLMVDAEEHPELVEEIWRHSIGPRRAYIEDILRRGVTEGLVRPDADLPLLVDMLIAPVVTRVRQRRDPLTDTQVTELVDIILVGVAP